MMWENGELLRYLLMNALDLTLILRFFGKIFGRRRLETGWTVSLAVFFLLFFSCFSLPEIPGLHLVSLSFWSALFLLCYQGPARTKAVVALVLLALSGLCQAVPWFLLNRGEETPVFAAISIGQLLFACVLELGGRLFHVRQSSLGGKLPAVLLMIPAASLLAVPCILLLSLREGASAAPAYYYLLPLFLCFVLINLVAFFLTDRLSANLEAAEQKRELEEQLRRQTDFYRSLEKAGEDVRRLKHDMRNDLETLYGLLEQEKAAEAQAFTGQLLQSVRKTEKVIHTQNPAFDIIVNNKKSAAAQHKIRFQEQINIPPALPIGYEETVAILGNLLDNAIEAQQELAEEDRSIEFHASYNAGLLLLSIRNSCRDRIEPSSPQTRKEDKTQHGLGLRNVRRAVDSLGGTLKLSAQEHSFRADVLLCLPASADTEPLAKSPSGPQQAL